MVLWSGDVFECRGSSLQETNILSSLPKQVSMHAVQICECSVSLRGHSGRVGVLWCLGVGC